MTRGNEFQMTDAQIKAAIQLSAKQAPSRTDKMLAKADIEYAMDCVRWAIKARTSKRASPFENREYARAHIKSARRSFGIATARLVHGSHGLALMTMTPNGQAWVDSISTIGD